MPRAFVLGASFLIYHRNPYLFRHRRECSCDLTSPSIRKGQTQERKLLSSSVIEGKALVGSEVHRCLVTRLTPSCDASVLQGLAMSERHFSDTFRKLSVFIKKSTRTGAIKTPRYPRLNYGWYNTHIPPSG